MKKTKNRQKFIFNTAILLATLFLAYIIATSEVFKSFMLQLVPISIIVELIAGAFYTSFLTVPVSLSLFSVLAEEGNLFVIVLVGAIGATIGDYIIMNVFQKNSHRVKIKSKKWKRLQKNKTTKVALTILGLLCLVVPVPDEVAMSILGITRITIRNFLLLVYPAKAFGIFLVVSSMRLI